MAISATCDSCKESFKARDEIAGKRVKCPKCKSPMTIPQATSKPAGKPKPAATKAKPKPKPKPKPAAMDPMEALLNEANIGPIHRGPMCPDCGTPVSQGTVICVDCGFNIETGSRLRTSAGYEEGAGTAGMSDAESILRRAEEELGDGPIGEEEDFGDGGDSFVVAGVALFFLVIAVIVCLFVILSMDYISQYFNSGAISTFASGLLWLGMAIWITIVAFKASPGHGIACILTGGIYCIIFGFMQGKALLLPTIILLVAFVVGLASGIFVLNKGIGPLEPAMLQTVFDTNVFFGR